jgi:hypothetical protein
MDTRFWILDAENTILSISAASAYPAVNVKQSQCRPVAGNPKQKVWLCKTKPIEFVLRDAYRENDFAKQSQFADFQPEIRSTNSEIRNNRNTRKETIMKNKANLHVSPPRTPRAQRKKRAYEHSSFLRKQESRLSTVLDSASSAEWQGW